MTATTESSRGLHFYKNVLRVELAQCVWPHANPLHARSAGSKLTNTKTIYPRRINVCLGLFTA